MEQNNEQIINEISRNLSKLLNLDLENIKCPLKKATENETIDEIRKNSLKQIGLKDDEIASIISNQPVQKGGECDPASKEEAKLVITLLSTVLCYIIFESLRAISKKYNTQEATPFIPYNPSTVSRRKEIDSFDINTKSTNVPSEDATNEQATSDQAEAPDIDNSFNPRRKNRKEIDSFEISTGFEASPEAPETPEPTKLKSTFELSPNKLLGNFQEGTDVLLGKFSPFNLNNFENSMNKYFSFVNFQLLWCLGPKKLILIVRNILTHPIVLTQKIFLLMNTIYNQYGSSILNITQEMLNSAILQMNNVKAQHFYIIQVDKFTATGVLDVLMQGLIETICELLKISYSGDIASHQVNSTNYGGKKNRKTQKNKKGRKSRKYKKSRKGIKSRKGRKSRK
jgi:hypothetical protein